MQLIVWLHALVAFWLALYGANALFTTLVYLRRRRQTSAPPPLPTTWPTVTVQLPIFNELHVVERLIDAVAGLDYPRDRLQIQVLDDSTDETTALAQARVEHYRRQGVDIALLHRVRRKGYKAGALAEALGTATGEFIAIFDADFAPPADFLRRTVPYLAADPGLGFVQTRWGHLNADYSPLTRAQTLALDGHFVVEQAARQRSGWFFGFNGTAGLWRRGCIEAAGGWQTDTLCEDLDLSYRAQLGGWRGLYLPDVVAPAEVPPQLAAYRRQQARWATGSVQTLRKLGGRVATAPRPLLTRIEGLLHLSAYLCHPLMVALLLLTLPLLLLAGDQRGPLHWLMAYLGFATAGPPLLFAVAQRELHPKPWGRRGWLARMTALPVLMLLGTGVALSNTVAVLRGLSGRPTAFRRTPKFRVENRSDAWQGKRYALPADPIVLGELALAAYALLTVAVAVARDYLYAVPFMLLYAAGFGMVAGVTLWQGRRRRPASPRTLRRHRPVPQGRA